MCQALHDLPANPAGAVADEEAHEMFQCANETYIMPRLCVLRHKISRLAVGCLGRLG